jgi:hypothetical protein
MRPRFSIPPFLIPAFGLVSLVGGLAACSYIFESAIPESDVLPTTTPPGGGGIDANDPDAGGCPDRLCDGGVIPDANPFDADVPFCETAGTSLFCADFDDNASAGVNTFGTPQTTAGARLEVATTISLSPRRSMLSVANGNGANAALIHPLGASPSDVTIASSILITAYNATESRLTMLRLANGAATTCQVWLGTTATAFTLTQLCTTNGAEIGKLVTDIARPIDRGRWHRYSIALKLAPTKTLTLDIDNVRVADVLAIDQITAQPTDAIFGIQNLVGTNMTLFQDNLRVTSP